VTSVPSQNTALCKRMRSNHQQCKQLGCATAGAGFWPRRPRFVCDIPGYRYGICCGQNDTGKDFSPSPTVLPCQYHSFAALYSLITTWMMGNSPSGGRNSRETQFYRIVTTVTASNYGSFLVVELIIWLCLGAAEISHGTRCFIPVFTAVTTPSHIMLTNTQLF
jgi:hypothetical protein